MKELLGEELYNQVKEKIGDKELIINDGSYIPKKKFDDLNNDKKDLQKQLENVNAKVQELSSVDAEKLNKEIEDLKSKYETDTKALNDKWNAREKEYLISDITRDLKFSSESAKKTFIRDLTEKDLKIENGKMLGYDDFLNEYRKNDEGAFIPEKKDDGQKIDLGGDHDTGKVEDLSHEKSILGI